MSGQKMWLARAELGAAMLAVVLLFAAVPHAVTGDGHVRLDALDKVLTRGVLPDQRYSYIGPLFASPIWLRDGRTRRVWWVERYNVFVLAVGAAAAWWLLRDVTDARVRSSLALLLVGAGMMPNHVRDFYGEVFTAVCVATGLLAVIVRGRRAGWIAVALGVANTPATAPGLLMVAAWRWWHHRKYDGVTALIAAAAIILLENWLVRGDPFQSGYSGDHGARTVLPFSARPGFSYPLLLGVLSLLFSFGKGVVLFAPGLALVAQARREVTATVADLFDAWMLFVAGVLLVYAKWWAWYGGWYWGPRFLLIAVYPAALALAVMLSRAGALSWGRRVLITLAALWTVWVGVSGAVFGNDGLDICMADSYALEHLCWYVPEFSPLFRPLVTSASVPEVWQRAWVLLATVCGILLVVRNGPPGRSRLTDKGSAPQ